jgi:hypothetical protein
VVVIATAYPPVGAGPLIVTVPVDAAGPTTEAGFVETDTTVAAVIVRVALADCPFAEAPMLAVVFVATPTVATGNVVDVCPAGTVTGLDTDAPVPAVSRTEVPPVGAA